MTTGILRTIPSFVANDVQTGTQSEARAAFLSNGTFVLIWEEDSNRLSTENEYNWSARLFDSDGTPLGPSFLAIEGPDFSDPTARRPNNVELIALDDGGYRVSWDNNVRDADPTSSYQDFDADGTARGDVVTLPWAGFSASYFHFADGSTLLTVPQLEEIFPQERDGIQPNGPIDATAQSIALVDNTGAVQGTPTLLFANEPTSYDWVIRDIAQTETGFAAVATNQFGDLASRFFDATLTPQSPVQILGSDPSLSGLDVSVGVHPSYNGTAIITWIEETATHNERALKAAALNNDGTRSIPEFLVSTELTTHGGPTIPLSIAAVNVARQLDLIVWTESVDAPQYLAATDETVQGHSNVVGQLFDWRGDPVGDRLSFGETTANNQNEIFLTRSADGKILVSWTDGSAFAVNATDAEDIRIEIYNPLLTGTPEADVLYGNPGDDIIDGLAGEDILRGLPGDDTMTGGLGNDLVEGEEGNDSLSGDAGNDRVWGAAGDDTLDGGDGDDELLGGIGADILLGGDGNDTLTSYASNASSDELANTLNGGAGDDSILAGDGADLIIGGAGADTIRDGNGDDTIQPGLGADVIRTDRGNDLFLGTLEEFDGDTISWFNLHLTDTIQITGLGPGDVSTDYDHVAKQILIDQGDDGTVDATITMENFQALPFFARSMDGDTLTITAGSPNQLITGTEENDALTGDFGRDTIIGLGGNDTLSGEEGDDSIEGGDGRNILRGGPGDDRLYGGNGNDFMLGQEGDDYFVPGDNPGGLLDFDSISIGQGADLVDFRDVVTGRVIVNLGALNATGTAATINIDGAANTGSVDAAPIGSATILGVTNVLNESIAVGQFQFQFQGGSGDDRFNIALEAGQWMSVVGNDGNDVFDLSGDGKVRLDYFTERNITVDLAAGTVQHDTFTDTIIGQAWEVQATFGADSILGSDADESFIGRTGDDTIDGAGGFDLLRFDPGEYNAPVDVDLASGLVSGGQGAGVFSHVVSNIEHVRGSGYDDTIAGASEAERLEGFLGDDTLIGRGGDDTLLGGEGTDTAIIAAETSGITVFAHNEGGVSGLRLETIDGIDVIADDVEQIAFDNETLTYAQLANLVIPDQDLTILDFNIVEFQDGPFALLPGERLTVTALVENDRSETVAAGYTLGVYLSDDAAVDATDRLFSRHETGAPVQAGATRLVTWNVELPDDLAGGQYTLAAFADPDNSLTETDETNNQSATVAIDVLSLISGTNVGQTLTGTDEGEVINALGGFDWIIPGRGDDTVDGGVDRDMISYSDIITDVPGRGGAFMVDLDLGGGTVNVFGGEMDQITSIERATGSIFADVLRGTDGNDELRGIGDYDWFVATPGQDTLNGGNGLDMITFLEAQSSGAPVVQDIFATDGVPPTGAAVGGVLLDLADGSNNTGLAAGLTLISVERVTGSSHQDVFFGDGEQNDFRGLGGFDWFVSSTGGRERYFGGDGVDTVTYFNAGAGVIASLRNGAGEFGGQETGFGSAGDAIRDLYFEIENLVGSDFDDRLEGNRERNDLVGRDGNDYLLGYGNTDYLKGGLGNDTLDGGAGSDFALFDGNRSDYTLTRTSSTEVTIMGADGTDSLINVEYFQFDDQTANIWELSIV